MKQQEHLFGGSALTPGSAWEVGAADCVEWLGSLHDESVDLVLTDPPYASLDKHRAVGTTTRLASSWFKTVPNSYFPKFFAECFRVLSRDSHLYVICDQETMFAIKPMGEAAGFKFWKPIVWDKMTKGMGYHYRARCEFVLFFEKGKRRLKNLSTEDVLEVPWDEDAPTGDLVKARRVTGGKFVENWRQLRAQAGKPYPTEKPVGLLQAFISQSTEPGDVVADPFMGSGSCGEAALRLGRRFAGRDISAEAVSLAEARLRATEEDLETQKGLNRGA